MLEDPQMWPPQTHGDDPRKRRNPRRRSLRTTNPASCRRTWQRMQKTILLCLCCGIRGRLPYCRHGRRASRICICRLCTCIQKSATRPLLSTLETIRPLDTPISYRQRSGMPSPQQTQSRCKSEQIILVIFAAGLIKLIERES